MSQSSGPATTCPDADISQMLQPHLTYLLTDADGDTVRICSCGWESLPSVYPGDVEADCAVRVAQQEGFDARMNRLARRTR